MSYTYHATVDLEGVEINLYDQDVEIELEARGVVAAFDRPADIHDLLDCYISEGPSSAPAAIAKWVNEHAVDLPDLAWKKNAPRLTDHQKAHISAAISILQAVQELTGKDMAETRRVLLALEQEMEGVE